MNIRIIAASAGTGKTYRLTAELEAAISSGRATPSGIIATTFTTQAAAELIERARARLLQRGHASAAEQLLAARIGTVNSVFGALVDEFAFELGLSPVSRVLDDEAADVELRRALARVVTEEQADELDRFRQRFESDRDWRIDVRRIVEAARANGMTPADLAICAARSCQHFDDCLGPETTEDLDAALSAALRMAIDVISCGEDDTKGTAKYLEMLRAAASDLASPQGLSWGTWAMLAKEVPTKRSLAHATPIHELARRHTEHPQLRAEVRALVTRVFEVAAASLATYQAHKREHSVVDFIDQEGLALELLRRPGVRAALAGEIQLVLIDEFQDTSPLQLALFLELASLANESIWVGDPKQAIYGFRGTDPSLMDAAVEALTSTTTDPDLVDRAARAVSRGVESLSVSYRSRSALVALTSEIFSRAFASQGIPEERTRITAASTTDAPELGACLEYWPLVLERAAGTDNESGRAAAVAAGVRDLLARRVAVRDAGRSGDDDPLVDAARPINIAVLCRTNRQCQAVADALGAIGVPVVVPRMGLLATPEARVVHAGLALWLDPEDALAAAELARLVDFPDDVDGFVARVLAAPGRDAFRDEQVVARIVKARAARPDLQAVAALDATIDATEVRALCASWGNTARRHANLDALRAHATTYTSEAAASGRPATLAGLIQYLELVAPRFARWDQARRDRQALVVGEDAVTVTTWHRAKGLEWPITILFGLESLRTPTSFGVHVMTDRETFDVTDPLGGRWIRFWPNPYTTANQLGAVRVAVDRTAAHAGLVAKADREALRVLYVGWTRARDRLVFAAQRGKLLDGLLSKLIAIDPALISEPPSKEGVAAVQWAGAECALEVTPTAPTALAVPTTPEPGWITRGRVPRPYPIARLTPSTMEAISCTLGEVVVLGPRLRINGNPAMEAVGDAIHGFLAADHRDLDASSRLALAHDLLAGHFVPDSMVARDIVEAADRLWNWIESRFPAARIQREWPIAHRQESGTLVIGTVDLVVDHDQGLAVIDHKSFPGNAAQAAERTLDYSGQLAAYSAALEAATGKRVAGTWIHFPVRGCLQEVHLTVNSTVGQQ